MKTTKKGNCNEKHLLKHSLKMVKHRRNKIKKNLFSLQHQTINILKNAEKYSKKLKKNTKNLNNLMKNASLVDNERETYKWADYNREEKIKAMLFENDNSNFNNSANGEPIFKSNDKCHQDHHTNSEEIQNESSNAKLNLSENNLMNINKKRRISDSIDNFNNDIDSSKEEPIKEFDDTIKEEKLMEDNLIDMKDQKPILCHPNIDFYQFNKTSVLLTLLHPCSLYFIGVLEVKVLAGSINVLGYNLNQLSGKHSLYSPRGSSHLSIATKDAENFDNETIKVLTKYNIPKEKINDLRNIFNKNIVLLVLNRDSSDLSKLIWPNFVEKYSKHTLSVHLQNQRFNAIEDSLQAVFQVQTEFTPKLINEMDDWDAVYSLISKGIQRTMICGGKGVGKSTLLRYLINRSLSKWEKLLVLDLDPGQSEFTIPGCISAFIVSSPLLGPSFTHILSPVRSMYFGLIEANQGLKYYFDCVQNVIDFCHTQEEFQDIPWFINTMGFSKGLGVLLTSSVIKKISPSILIQIESKFKGRNYPSPLTPKFIEQNILNLSKCSTDPETIDYKLILTDSAVVNVEITTQERKKKQPIDTWGLSSPSLRNIMILSYFGKLLNSKVKNIHQAEPYVVDINKIHLEVLNENLTKDEVLDAVNGDLVSLCNKNFETNNINTCLGFGIVRAINKEEGELFLLTPLKENELVQVNSLIKGSVVLPERLYSHQPESILGQIPYVGLTKNILSNTIKKTYKNYDLKFV